MGLRRKVYSGGAEFLRAANLESGCVLLDLRMPGMSGHEVQEELAQRGETIPVVIMSGEGDLGEAVRAMKLGALDFVGKPPREDVLLPALGRALDLRRRGEDRRKARVNAAARLERCRARCRSCRGCSPACPTRRLRACSASAPRTVEMHRANMMDDLGISSVSEAVRLAIDAELPPLQEERVEQPALALAEADARGAAPSVQDPVFRRYEEKLRRVLEASTDGAWEMNVATGALTFSPRLLERFGYTEEAAPKQLSDLENFVHPEDYGRFRADLEDHLEGRTETVACELRLLRPGGDWGWIYDCGSVNERDPLSGAPLRMVGTFRTSPAARRKRSAPTGRADRACPVGRGRRHLGVRHRGAHPARLPPHPRHARPRSRWS